VILASGGFAAVSVTAAHGQNLPPDAKRIRRIGWLTPHPQDIAQPDIDSVTARLKALLISSHLSFQS
jgi:hypothetical protein